MEDDAVHAGLEVVGETGSTVAVRAYRSDLLVAAVQLDGDIGSRLPCGGVENVGRK